MNRPLLLALFAMACGPKNPSALDTRPPVMSPSPWQSPLPAEARLSNGAALWTLERAELPLVSLRVVIPGGASTDPRDRPGLAALTDTMLLHGAGDLDAAAFAQKAEDLAISIDAATSGTDTILTLDCPAAQLEEGLRLLSMAILQPRFEAAALDRVREQRLGDLAENNDDGRYVARQVGAMLYRGAAHPLAHPTLGTEAGVKAATIEELKASWAGRSSPRGATIVAAGAVGSTQLTALLDRYLVNWSPPATSTVVPIPAAAGVNQTTWAFVDKPGSSQTVLYVVQPGWKASDPELEAARVSAIALGGTFTSRLNQLLREKKGYTYGARSSLAAGAVDGMTIHSTAVQAEVTAPALQDLLSELKRIQEGIGADEVAKAVGARRQDVVESMGSRAGIADTFADLASLGRSPADLRTGLEQSSKVHAADASKAFQRASLDRSVVVVVGDLSQIRVEVEKAVPASWQVVPAP